MQDIRRYAQNNRTMQNEAAHTGLSWNYKQAQSLQASEASALPFFEPGMKRSML